VLARALLYSDSINGSDRTTRSLREMLGGRFGYGGKGFLPIAPGWQYQRHKDVAWDHAAWRVFVVNRGDREDGRYGLGGVLAVSRGPRARARFATVGEGIGAEVSRFRLFYQAHPEGGSIALSVDGAERERLDTRADAVEDRVHDIEVPRGSHALELDIVDGEARLYGVAMERDPPGVVVDGLMLVGAFTRVLGNFDEAHWARQIALREADLIAFWLGGNDATSRTVGFDRGEYVADYTAVLQAAHAGRPEASCLVVSVLDVGERVDGEIRSRNRVPRVVEAQREAALAAGCAFFDAYEAIGGAGTMRRWARSSPRLVSVDYRHLSGEGATVIAGLIERALLKAYDDWLVATAAAEP
jgi:lysophospholipase L1-like esterase